MICMYVLMHSVENMNIKLFCNCVIYFPIVDINSIYIATNYSDVYNCLLINVRIAMQYILLHVHMYI